jgi:hypothetical protein
MDERERTGDPGQARSAAQKSEDAELRRLAKVAVMQAADFGNLHDLPRRGELDRPEVGCVLVEREVGTRLMVVGEVAGQDAVEVSLAENENVIQTLAPDRSDQALGEGILPRAVRCREDFVNPHALHSVAKLLAKHQVTIAQEIGRPGLVREGVHDLLGRPGRGGVLGDVKVDDPPAMVSEQDENEEDAQAGGGHGEEVDRHQVPDMVGEERPPGLRRSRTTLRHEAGDGALPTSMPSFRSSPWMRGAPHKGFAAAIFLTRAAISARMGGRPPVGRPESRVQYSRKRRRCHRRTVSGETMTRACLQLVQTLASPTHSRRSTVRSFGRGSVRL